MRKITENINGREDITIDSTAIKMVIREYYELNANKFNNLDKQKMFELYNLWKLQKK